jgi:hypothetical protein
VCWYPRGRPDPVDVEATQSLDVVLSLYQFNSMKEIGRSELL